jgi:hypothetical protein
VSLVGPFPASAVIARLAELPELRVVAGAAGLQAALETPPNTLPAAYVLTEETGQAPGDYSSAFAQPMRVVIKVVLFARHAGDASGAKAVGVMEGIERAVRSSLRDWSPGDLFEPLWVSASGSDDFYGGRLIRQVLFRTEYRDQELTP